MTKFFNSVLAKCKQLSAKREVDLIEDRINSLKEKRAKLTGKVEVADIGKVAKVCKYSRTSEELLVEVNRKSIVKDIRRHLEAKVLRRNMSAKNEDDYQLLYNHLHYFFSLKHDVTMPYVIEKNGTHRHINDYAKHRTTSVINCATAAHTFTK